MDLINKINKARDYILNKIGFVPEIALILGSGLGEMAEEAEEKIIVNYSEIPNFPISTVHGHKGRLVFGMMKGKKVVFMQGRFHYYEGYKMEEVVFPVWVFKSLGVKKLIVTNAAGGVNTSFNPGDLMIIKDHINYTNSNLYNLFMGRCCHCIRNCHIRYTGYSCNLKSAMLCNYRFRHSGHTYGI